MIKVLFVCKSNICRSPMAEAVFQNMIDQPGLADDIMVDSAATDDWHINEKAHPGTLRVLQEKGLSYNGRARLFTRSDLNQFDYVLAMDRSNLSAIMNNSADTRIEPRLFLSYANKANLVEIDEVPDPQYNTDEAFDGIYQLILVGCTALFEHIRSRNSLL